MSKTVFEEMLQKPINRPHLIYPEKRLNIDLFCKIKPSQEYIVCS